MSSRVSKSSKVVINTDFRTVIKLRKRAKRQGVSLDQYISNYFRNVALSEFPLGENDSVARKKHE